MVSVRIERDGSGASVLLGNRLKLPRLTRGTCRGGPRGPSVEEALLHEHPRRRRLATANAVSDGVPSLALPAPAQSVEVGNPSQLLLRSGRGQRVYEARTGGQVRQNLEKPCLDLGVHRGASRRDRSRYARPSDHCEGSVRPNRGCRAPKRRRAHARRSWIRERVEIASLGGCLEARCDLPIRILASSSRDTSRAARRASSPGACTTVEGSGAASSSSSLDIGTVHDRGGDTRFREGVKHGLLPRAGAPQARQ